LSNHVSSPHKIPKNFSDEKEDNAMLLDVRRETKKRKKNPKFKNTTFTTSY
jgi:hypothetical protein